MNRRRKSSKPALRPPFAQYGASLVVSLLMLVVILLLGSSAAEMALQSEKASRNDRDRQVAFQAAEAGLMDAELDIENAPANSRSSLFAPDSRLGFVDGCGSGLGNVQLGLCNPSAAADIPVWESVDFMDASDNARTVPYGRFTGQSFQTSGGILPGRVPRYVIELMTYNRPGEDAGQGATTYFYRITAIGFGMRDSTQVVLQTYYRKESA